MSFVMEGKNLAKFDLDNLTLIGKYTLHLFLHFLAG